MTDTIEPQILEAVLPQCVVSLTWTLKDGQGEELDVLDEPVEFLLGADDLLHAMEHALHGKHKGEELSLHFEPETAFGDYDEELVQWVERKDCKADIAEGDAMLELPGKADVLLPEDCVWIVTELYPEQVVLDANHPLAGMALNIDLKIHAIREARVSEIDAGTLGTGFFRMRDVL